MTRIDPRTQDFGVPDELKNPDPIPDLNSPLFDADFHRKLRPWIYGIGMAICALVILVYRVLEGAL